MKLSRISVDSKQMGGTPCMRGLRIPVAAVVGMAAEGMSEAEILGAYPDLEAEDIREALRYAAKAKPERKARWQAAASDLLLLKDISEVEADFRDADAESLPEQPNG